MARKKFKRYFRSDVGKGSEQRDAAVDDATVADNWCRTYGHQPTSYDKSTCRSCGAQLDGS